MPWVISTPRSLKVVGGDGVGGTGCGVYVGGGTTGSTGGGVGKLSWAGIGVGEGEMRGGSGIVGVAVAVLKVIGWGGSGSAGNKISKAASRAIICSSKKPPIRKGVKLE